MDTESNLYNYDARLYDPVIGRFVSPDPTVPEPFNPQYLNRYSYCLNNPLIYTDPTGLIAMGHPDHGGCWDSETGKDISTEEAEARNSGAVNEANVLAPVQVVVVVTATAMYAQLVVLEQKLRNKHKDKSKSKVDSYNFQKNKHALNKKPQPPEEEPPPPKIEHVIEETLLEKLAEKLAEDIQRSRNKQFAWGALEGYYTHTLGLKETPPAFGRYQKMGQKFGKGYSQVQQAVGFFMDKLF